MLHQIEKLDHPILIWQEGGSESPGQRIFWLVDSRNQSFEKMVAFPSGFLWLQTND